MMNEEDIPKSTRKGTTERDRVSIKTLDRAGLETFVESLGEPAYRGRQIFQWLFGKGVTSFDDMTNLPKDLRDRLGTVAKIDTIEPVLLQTAGDQTSKALLSLSSGHQIETVLIPDFDDDGHPIRLTVCVSSQVGCAMACSFCATGRMGFKQNLTSGEIFDQVWFMNKLALERFNKPVTNIVYMGMGEPLLNDDNVLRSVALLTHPEGLGHSPRRITISTVGLARRIQALADAATRVQLAVSLHAPFEEKRSSIMPVNRAPGTNLQTLKKAIQYYTQKTGQRVTYEYCMFAGFNDSIEDAKELAKIVSWASSKVNLIMYNHVEGLNFSRTSEHQLNQFLKVLVDRNVTVTVRRSRGQDIAAACGQLAAKDN